MGPCPKPRDLGKKKVQQELGSQFRKTLFESSRNSDFQGPLVIREVGNGSEEASSQRRKGKETSIVCEGKGKEKVDDSHDLSLGGTKEVMDFEDGHEDVLDSSQESDATTNPSLTELSDSIPTSKLGPKKKVSCRPKFSNLVVLFDSDVALPESSSVVVARAVAAPALN